MHNRTIIGRITSVSDRNVAAQEHASEKTVSIPSQSERRERDFQELFRKAKRPVALFVDDAHDLHPKTLTALKRPVELVTEGGGKLAVILVGHPKLRNDLKRPLMEEIGDRTAVFEFGALLAAKLKTPLQIGRHLVRAFEAGFEASVKPIYAATVDGVLSRQIDDLEPQLTRHG